MTASTRAALDSYVVVHSGDRGEGAPKETLVELAIPADAYDKGAGSAVPIRREFNLAPGHYQARLLLRDRASGAHGERTPRVRGAAPERPADVDPHADGQRSVGG